MGRIARVCSPKLTVTCEQKHRGRVDPRSDLPKSTSRPKRAFAGDVKLTEKQPESSAAPVIKQNSPM